jgi:hypothetical protein
MRAFAVGSTTNKMTLEVRWRSGKLSVFTNILPNQLCVPDEKINSDAKATSLSSSFPEPIFRDMSQLLGHEHHEEPFDDFEKQPLLSKRLSQLGPGVAWCDVNGDGLEDLVIGTGRGGSLRVLINTGQGKFGTVDIPAFKQVATDDLTGIVGWSSEPGHTSLLVGQANYETGKTNSPAVLQHELFFGNVDTTTAVPGELSSAGPLALADIDGDGRLELFVGGRVISGKYPAPASSRIYRQEGNKWVLDETNSKLLKEVGLVSGAVWSDLEGDGYPELVLGCEWGPVRVYRNHGGHLEAWDAPVNWVSEPGNGRKRPEKLSQLTGWWNGVTAGDFDGDGRLDLVLGNWGLNNKYREFSGLRVYHGDYDGDGVWDLVEAYWEPELKKEVPWRDWKTMRGAIPKLSERFKTYREYGQASVEEIFGEGLKQMNQLQVEVLE